MTGKDRVTLRLLKYTAYAFSCTRKRNDFTYFTLQLLFCCYMYLLCMSLDSFAGVSSHQPRLSDDDFSGGP